MHASLGEEFDVPIATVTVGPLTVLEIELQIEPEFFPTYGFEVSVEGSFGPGGFLKGKIKLFDVEFSGDDKGIHF